MNRNRSRTIQEIDDLVAESARAAEVRSLPEERLPGEISLRELLRKVGTASVDDLRDPVTGALTCRFHPRQRN